MDVEEQHATGFRRFYRRLDPALEGFTASIDPVCSPAGRDSVIRICSPDFVRCSAEAGEPASLVQIQSKKGDHFLP
jgi:hypothetical protein